MRGDLAPALFLRSGIRNSYGYIRLPRPLCSSHLKYRDSKNLQQMAPSATTPPPTNGASSKLSFDTFHNVINGKLVSTSKTRHGINPATKSPGPEVPIATPQDVDEAVAAARMAFKTWSRTSIEERKKAMQGLADGMASHREDFAKLLTREQGKPVCSPGPFSLLLNSEVAIS